MITHVEKLGKNYQPDIDGLRAIAVLSVVINHYWPNLLTGGYIGVDIFFVISGYIITKLIAKEVYDLKFSLKDFYIRRIKRILPVLFIVLFISVIFSIYIMLPSDAKNTIEASIATILFGANFLYWKQLQFGYFATMDTGIHPLVHTWSLAVEEQFYIIFPLLLYYILKLKNIYINLLLLGFIIVSLILTEIFIKNHSVAVFFLSPFRFWELLFGVFIAINIKRIALDKFISEIISLIGFFIIIYCLIYFDNQTKFPGLNALLPVIGTSLIIFTCYSKGMMLDKTIINFILSKKPLVQMGLISYSLYLIHWPLFVIYKYYNGLDELSNLEIFSLLFLSIIISYFSFKYIEQYFRNLTVTNVEIFLGLTFIFIMSFIFFNVYRLNIIKNLNTNIYYVSYDKQRNPEIEYKKCDQIHDVNNWCIIGEINSKPTYIILGDSHLISWAPAFNDALKNVQKSAVVAPFSACPPLIGIKYSSTKGCSERSIAIEKLISNTSIENFIITGNWIHHFTKSKINNDSAGHGITESFIDTFNLLEKNNKKIILIGPVPIYEKSVPLMLGLENFYEKKQSRLILNINQEYLMNDNLYKTIKKIMHDNRSIKFYDPLSKLCNPYCVNSINNKSLYHDSNHLNNFGASLFIDDFTDLLKVKN